MPQYLVAIHLADDYDSSTESEATIRDISSLNKEMISAGVRTFVGGLEAAGKAKTLRAQSAGRGTRVGAQGRQSVPCTGRGASDFPEASRRAEVSGTAKARRGSSCDSRSGLREDLSRAHERLLHPGDARHTANLRNRDVALSSNDDPAVERLAVDAWSSPSTRSGADSRRELLYRAHLVFILQTRELAFEILRDGRIDEVDQ